MTPPPVLVLVTDADRRGAQIHGGLVARGLSQLGVSAEVAALSPGPGPETLQIPTLGPSRLHPATLRSLRARIAAARAVIAFGSTTLPASVVAGTGLATPLVYVSIGDIRFWTASPARRVRTGLLLRRATRVVALWPGAAAGLREHLRVPAHRVRTTRTAVEADRFTPVSGPERVAAREVLALPAQGTVIVYVGALTPEKRVDLAIDAVARLSDARLLIAGAGPEHQRLARHAAQHAGERVRFLGRVEDVRGLLAAADALVLPSRSEGMPAVLIEAGLSGLPVIASNVGGVAEVIEDGKTGRLVNVDTGPDVLAAAIREVLEHGRGMGRAAHERCRERFNLPIVARHWQALIDEVAPPSP